MRKFLVLFFITISLITSVNLAKANDTLVIRQKGAMAVGASMDNIAYKFSNNPNALGFSLLGKYYLQSITVIRSRLTINTDNFSNSVQDSITNASGDRSLRILDTSQTQISFSISLGIEHHFLAGKRLDPYVASDFIVKREGAISFEAKQIEKNNLGQTTSLFTRESDGGFDFRLNLMFGANYFLTHRFSIGLETGLGLNYLTKGGDIIETTINTDISGNISSQLNTGKATSAGFNVNTIPSLNFSLVYYF